uniref:Putative DNA binding, helix-turn-helix domain containing protein n=1 Tax=viral metagenome TaxID=1070528 RepID=A0A6M3Y7U0_9ZZZZ
MKNLNLKMAILRRYQTQADFAYEIGSHESRISRVIMGRLKLTKDEAQRWSDLLGCNISEIQGDSHVPE